VEPGHPHRRAHLPYETFNELEVFVRVRPLVAHQLDDADDAALVLDRQHHRGLHLSRARVGKLADGALAIDVVEGSALVAGDAAANVVLKQRLTAADDLALHAAGGRELQLGQRLRVNVLALDPGVLAANQALALVERGHDNPVMLNRVREQLVKAVVNALDLERLAEVASRVEQELSRLGLAPQIVLDLLVVGENVVRRLGGHVLNVSLCGICGKSGC
jgi:hypothetical protein